MKNNILKILIVLFFSLIQLNVSASEQFNFEVTELEITNQGNIIRGLNRGTATSESGIIIEADYFEYDKIKNILKAKGNVIFNDQANGITITTEIANYFKNNEKVFTQTDSKAIDNEGKVITADKFNYDKINNLIIATGNVKIVNKLEDYEIFSNEIKYFKNQDKVTTEGKTTSIMQSKYNIDSSNVTLLFNTKKIFSKDKTKIQDDNSNIFFLKNFNYSFDKKILKGENIKIITDFNKINSDKYFFKNAIIDIGKMDFLAKDPKIYVHKGVFGNNDNDPRLYGSSSKKDGKITVVHNAVFTSCKIDKEKCPPWKIKAKKITHDKNKKQLIYDHAVLHIYDIPIFYYPKFFHPDPTVKRQSGFLQPRISNSKILGSSIYLPYYKVIDIDKDYTFKPTFFDKDILMLQNEYREIRKNSNIEIDFAHVDGFKSSITNTRKSISHLFTKINWDLNIDRFLKSGINLNIEKVNNDNYLKIFDSSLSQTNLKPEDSNNLVNEVKLYLSNEEFKFDLGFKSFENLQLGNSDRYQYILPYYNFSKNLSQDFFNGSLLFKSKGNNNLKNTNNLRSSIINDINYSGKEILSDIGIKSNFNIFLKNLNTVAKNDDVYNSSPSYELENIYELSNSFPLIKKNNNKVSKLTPKTSLRFNPSSMKNYSTINREINVDNIFDINRLAMDNTFEEGASLTLGLDFKTEDEKNYNKYFKFDIATVLRPEEINEIPKTSTLNKKKSNIFGSIENNFSDNLSLEYDFAVKNNLNKIEYNSIKTSLSLNNFVTTFNFIEKNGAMGSANSIENSTVYNFDENNQFSFNTRRNRKINLTEFYDLVYEYKRDCLTAALKYRKTYYEDRELKPSEDLMFLLTFYPLTTYEQKIDDNLYNK